MRGIPNTSVIYRVPTALWNPWKAWNIFWLLEPSLEIAWNLCKNLESPWTRWNLRKTQKNRSTHICFFLSLECCIDSKPSWNKWQKLLEILFTYNKVTTVFQKYPWKCAVDPLITLDIPLNLLIWGVWEPWIYNILQYTADHDNLGTWNFWMAGLTACYYCFGLDLVVWFNIDIIFYKLMLGLGAGNLMKITHSLVILLQARKIACLEQ